MECFSKLEKSIKKGKKSASRKKICRYDSNSSSNSKKGIGLGDTGDLVHVEHVGNKSKRTKLNVYTPSDPIKITHEHNCSHISNSEDSSDSNSLSESDEIGNSDEFSKHKKFSYNKNFSEQQHNTPHEENMRKTPRPESQLLQLWWQRNPSKAVVAKMSQQKKNNSSPTR